MPSTPKPRDIMGQPSWRLASDRVEAFVTQIGGMLAPVTFDKDGRKLQPLSVAPWHQERLDSATPSLLAALRGDFFCMPFGGNATPHRGERHPPHGEPANARWQDPTLTRHGDAVSLQCRLDLHVRTGTVHKRIELRQGQDFIYQSHTIDGVRGKMPAGHHAMLAFPDRPQAGVVSTSPFLHGQVFPGPFENPAEGGYQALRPGATFHTLAAVPGMTGDTEDVSRYPARDGFEDLVMLVGDPSRDWAWSAVTFARERFAWFAIKDPAVLPHTVLWLSNGGRHYPPWNGRHRRVMGIEEVASFFHLGLAESVKANALSRDGHPTALSLRADRPTVVRYGFGVAKLPAGFDRVERIESDDDGRGVTLIADSGKRARARIDLDAIVG